MTSRRAEVIIVTENRPEAPAAQTVSDIIEASRYLVLATADAAGRPWSSPVYFAHIGFTEFFWVSSPDVTHSRNIAVRPEVSIVVFDSQVAIGAGLRLYRAIADPHWILAKDGRPDHRIPVPLTWRTRRNAAGADPAASCHIADRARKSSNPGCIRFSVVLC
jgi:hypothetical protein